MSGPNVIFKDGKLSVEKHGIPPRVEMTPEELLLFLRTATYKWVSIETEVLDHLINRDPPRRLSPPI